MSAFRFPPPPPPPPKQPTEQADFGGYQGRGGHGNGPRGHRGGGNNYNQAGRGGYEGQRGGSGTHRGRGSQSGFSTRGGMSGPVTGDKRKWADRGGRGGSSQRPQSVQPSHSRNPHMSVAPAVPSFGFSLPSAGPAPGAATSQSTTSSVEPQQKAKRKYNILGLTPKGPDREDSDQEVDEEAAFAAQLLVQSGGLPNVQNRAEMAAWLAERKRRYPTKARLEEKQKAAQEAELERLKQRAKASRDAKGSKVTDAAKGDAATKSKQDRQREKLERHLRKAEKLRQQLSRGRSPTGAPTAYEEVTPIKPSLLGGHYNSDEEPDRDRDVDDASSGAGSSSDSDSNSDTPASDSSDNDAAPDEASSKIQTRPVQTPHTTQRKPKEARDPLPKHLVPWVKRGFCSAFLQQKPCRYGRQCRNKHKMPQEVRDAKMPRKRLFDRLVEQEVLSENLAAVNAVKALGATGFFNGI